jgi:hypothetical protein
MLLSMPHVMALHGVIHITLHDVAPLFPFALFPCLGGRSLKYLCVLIL